MRHEKAFLDVDQGVPCNRTYVEEAVMTEEYNWGEKVKRFMEDHGYKNVDVDPETNQLSMDFWPPPGYLKSFEFDTWGPAGRWPPPKDERLVGYRRSSNGTYQEVWELSNGHTWYGLYMPEGFVPPPGMANQ